MIKSDYPVWFSVWIGCFKADSGDMYLKTEAGVTRESHPRLVRLIARVTYCAAVAAGATGTAGA